MATSDILGLFTSPEQYQQQQDLMMQRQAAELAQLDPYQSVRFGAIRAGQQFGRGLAGILGAEDPQLRLISARQSALRGINLAEPESIFTAAQQLADAGDQQGALMLADYGRKAAADAALVTQRTREGRAAATPKELQIAAARAQLQDAIRKLEAMPPSPDRDAQLQTAKDTLASLPISGASKQTPDNIEIAERRAAAQGLQPGSAAYNTFIDKELERLTTKEKKEPGANISEVGVAVGTNVPVYIDKNKDEQFIYVRGPDGKQVRQPYFSGVDTTKSKTVTNVSMKAETAFAEKLGTLDAKRVDDALATRDNSIAAINSLKELTRLDNQGLISGSFATGRVGATNFLSTLGLVSGTDADKLSRSENYQKVAGDIILATLGGRLGAGFSNEDRNFIQRLIPQLENSAQARRQLLDFLVTKNNAIIEETTRLEDYARQNNSLKGYKPTIPIVKQPSRSAASELTDEQLRNLYNKGKGAK
jgi:lipoprotein-anchoring transpeptidase ErfK/SrfK